MSAHIGKDIREINTFVPLREIDKNSSSPAKTLAQSVNQTLPRLIFLTGTSTAGKTSIMREFVSNTPKTVELGTDDYEESRVVSLIKMHFPSDYVVLSQAIEDKDLYRFIFSPPDFIKANPKLFFKSGINESQQTDATTLNDSAEFFPKIKALVQTHKSTQDNEHFETILSHSNEGISVIFDTPNEKGLVDHLSKNPHHTRVERFLVYVPLLDLINRLPGRNADSLLTGNLPNLRQNIDLINQFMQTYRKANSDEPAIDIISREEIKKIFAEKRQEIVQENANAKENGRPTYAIEEDLFLEYFELTSPDSKVPITTKSDYKVFDGIFRTALQSPNISVQQLNAYRWERL